mgnify:FL=1
MTATMTTRTPIDLPAEAVHVWRAALDVDADALIKLAGVLDDTERARAARFRFDSHRAHYIAGRGILRSVLADYLAVEPAEVAFVYGPNGKPALARPHAKAGLEFNLSHSGGQALVAVARGRRVGVDIEQHRGDRDLMRLARRYFHANEAADVASADGEELARRFFFYSTCKEAYLKGIGGGITVGLDRFAVQRPSRPATAPLRLTYDHLDPDRWVLCALDAEQGYSAAVAYEQPNANLQWRVWRAET